MDFRPTAFRRSKPKGQTPNSIIHAPSAPSVAGTGVPSNAPNAKPPDVVAVAVAFVAVRLQASIFRATRNQRLKSQTDQYRRKTAAVEFLPVGAPLAAPARVTLAKT